MAGAPSPFTRKRGNTKLSLVSPWFRPTLLLLRFYVLTAQCTLVHLSGLAIACRLSVRPSVRLSVRL